MPRPIGTAREVAKAIIDAGAAGMSRAALIKATGQSGKHVANALDYLKSQGEIVRLAVKPAVYVATPKATPLALEFKPPPIFGKGTRIVVRKPKQTFREDATPDFSRAKIIREPAPATTAAWMKQPTQPPIGFSKLPLGATLLGMVV